MKKITIVTLFIASCIVSNAQYKKASFFNKNGRIYDIGIKARMQFGERKPAPGIFMSFGRQNASKHISHWYDLEFNFPTKFDYATEGGDPGDITRPVRVKGRTLWDYSLRYNFVYFFKTDDKEDVKFLPFVNLTVGYLSSPNEDAPEVTTTPNVVSIRKDPDQWPGSFLAGGGAGFVYMLTERAGLRVTANYLKLIPTPVDSEDTFIALKDHPVIMVAYRIRFIGD